MIRQMSSEKKESAAKLRFRELLNTLNFKIDKDLWKEKSEVKTKLLRLQML